MTLTHKRLRFRGKSLYLLWQKEIKLSKTQKSCWSFCVLLIVVKVFRLLLKNSMTLVEFQLCKYLFNKPPISFWTCLLHLLRGTDIRAVTSEMGITITSTVDFVHTISSKRLTHEEGLYRLWSGLRATKILSKVIVTVLVDIRKRYWIPYTIELLALSPDEHVSISKGVWLWVSSFWRGTSSVPSSFL